MGRHRPARTGARLQGPPRLDHADLRRRGGCHRPDRGQDEADGAGVRGSPPLNPILSCPPKRVSPSASPMTGSGGHQYAGNPRSIADVTGILGRPVPATPRLRRGCTVLARRSFSGGGKPGDDIVAADRAYFCGWAGCAGAVAEPPVGTAASAVLVDLPCCGCASPPTVAELMRRSCGLAGFASAIGTDALSCGNTSATAWVLIRLARR